MSMDKLADHNKIKMKYNIKTTTPMMKGPMPHMPYNVVRSISEQIEKKTNELRDKQMEENMLKAVHNGLRRWPKPGKGVTP